MGFDPAQAILVLTTLPDAGSARGMVAELVEERLVACGTIVPSVTSVYRWQDEVETEQETQVILKTRSALRTRVEDAVLQRHPYDVPELLVLEVAAGTERYLQWITDETSRLEETQ